MKNRYLNLQLVLIVLALLTAFFVTRNHRMSANWMGPYLSAAHNLEWGGEFNINVDEVKYFKELNTAEQDNYKFKKRDDLVHYNHNPIGYAYLIKGATMIFPFAGDQMAIILLQSLVYFLICFLFLRFSNLTLKQKWLFLFLFAVNPIILRFVPFNFYYFWQIIPSVLFAYLILNKTPNKTITFILIILLPFTYMTRPTLIFTLFFIGYLLYKKINVKYTFFSMLYVVLLASWLYQPTKKNIWFTIYTGIGAYENKYNIALNDNTTYKLYEDKTGKKLNASVGGNYYSNEVIEEFTKITKDKVMAIFKETPFIFIKNGIINTLQGYAIGFLNKGGDFVNYLIAFMGLVYIIILLYFKKYIWFLMIGFSLGTFTLYYPPIQAYMYGVYLLIVLSFISIFNCIYKID